MNPCSHSPYVTSSLTRRWVCLLWICLALSSVRIAYSIACYWKFFLLHLIQAPCLSRLCKADIMPILRILGYNGSLVTWTVEGLTTAKFKPLIFNVCLRVALYCEHVHSHDFVWLLLVA
jgi:hypothetical protein